MIHTAGISLNDLVVLMSVVIFTLCCVRVWNCWARVVIFYCVGLWVLYSLMPPSSGHKGHYNNITLRLICFLFFSSFFSPHHFLCESERMLMMMMMMKKKKGSLAVVALLVASVNCIVHPSKEDLTRKFHCNPTYKNNSFLLCVFLYFCSENSCWDI